MGMPREFTVKELDSILRSPRPIFVLDVRQDWEVDIAPLKGALNICLEDLPSKLDRLPSHGEPFVMTCPEVHV